MSSIISNPSFRAEFKVPHYLTFSMCIEDSYCVNSIAAYTVCVQIPLKQYMPYVYYTHSPTTTKPLLYCNSNEIMYL